MDTGNQESPNRADRQTTIETPRLILRGARPTDDKDLFECFRDPEVMRYWESLPHTSLDTTRSWLQKMIDGNNNGITDFVICLKPSTVDNNQNIDNLPVIGKAGVWHDNEIGFLLHRQHWRRGLGIEAVREVLDLVFGLSTRVQTQVPQSEHLTPAREVPDDVVADVDPRNEASLGTLKKLGFEVYATKEKTFLVGDQWVDSVYLSLRREVWVRRRTEI